MQASHDFDFSGPALEAKPPTDLHAKWLKRRGFMQGCASVPFAVKIATFHTLRYPGWPLKGQIWTNFGLRKFSLNFAFNIRGPEREHPLILYRSPFKVA